MAAHLIPNVECDGSGRPLKCDGSARPLMCDGSARPLRGAHPFPNVNITRGLESPAGTGGTRAFATMFAMRSLWP
jgi:hypothetical protein